MVEIEDRLYQLAEVEHLAQVTKRTLYNWIDTGYLKAVKVGGRWKVPPEEIERITQGVVKRYGSRVYEAGKPAGYTHATRTRKASTEEA